MDWYLTDSKSRIARVIHVVKKNVFRDNKGENIRVESELLVQFYNIQSILKVFLLVLRNSSNKRRIGGAALNQGRCLIEGSAYSSKYGKLWNLFQW